MKNLARAMTWAAAGTGWGWAGMYAFGHVGSIWPAAYATVGMAAGLAGWILFPNRLRRVTDRRV